MGRARGNPVAGPGGGLQDRSLLAGFLRAAVPRGIGVGYPGRVRGAVLGGRGDRAGAGRQLAAAVAVVANGTPEQIGEWCPQMFGGPGEVKLGAFCSSEPEAGSDVGAIKTRAVYDAAAGEWVRKG